MHIDFVIAENAGKIGYLSTNTVCPIWGYKQGGTLLDCLKAIREDYPDFSYTREGIIPITLHAREFEEKDKIYANKIKTRLERLPQPRLRQKAYART